MKFAQQAPPLFFPVARFRYHPRGWENQVRFMAPDAHVVELQGLGAQGPSLYHLYHLPPVMHGSYGTAAAPAESSRKNIFGFFARLVRGREGARILPCFSGIMVMPPDMTCRY